MSRGRLLWSLGLAALLSGCAGLPAPQPPDPTVVLEHPEATRLGRDLAAAEASHPGMSGFHLLGYDLESLVARVALADSAERTIDAQYYIYDSDAAGNILTRHLLEAADRGVRVRLLIDDYNVRNDRELAALCAHPNIEVRIFNPERWHAGALRLPEYLIDLRRSDHRMHNKLFVVDDEASVLGGRNIGDDYFNLGTGTAFRDFDLLSVGPVSRQAALAFAQFWNSPWSVPAPELARRKPTPADLAWVRHRIDIRLLPAADFERQYAGTGRRYLSDLLAGPGGLFWGDGQVVTEPPAKVDRSSPATDLVTDRLEQEWRDARSEILIEAAYFVPGESGIETFRRLHARGVAVRLLTSGLEATDAPLVYYAYRGYRRALLEAGVELYEFKLHRAGGRRETKWYRLRPAYAALHSKVMVFDRRRVWIGSFNYDPRSERLNTEVALVADCPALAAELASDIAEDQDPTRSWRVRLGPGGITWTGEQDGRTIVRRREPDSWWAGIGSVLLRLMPGMENQL
jgi:putative cardiolipin synthase